MMDLLFHIVCSMTVTCGFCIIYNVPLNKIPQCSIIGVISWISLKVFMYLGFSPVTATFIGSCNVWLFSNIFSRVFKDMATLFIIPGIICLVPGAGTYYTMLSMLGLRDASSAGTAKETMLIAGAIAAGLLMMGSLTGVCSLIYRKIKVFLLKHSL